ncbi:MAG: hypothetical protein H0V98_08345 [Chloroflexia bacterium]|jgi:hypothetical protein|nr:hypothetical protein [Chloroflexia bacterium]
MKYLCLVYLEEAKVDALPSGEYDAIRLAYRMPPAHRECIEIRPIQEVDDAGTAISSQSGRFLVEQKEVHSP